MNAGRQSGNTTALIKFYKWLTIEKKKSVLIVVPFTDNMKNLKQEFMLKDSVNICSLNSLRSIKGKYFDAVLVDNASYMSKKAFDDIADAVKNTMEERTPIFWVG